LQLYLQSFAHAASFAAMLTLILIWIAVCVALALLSQRSSAGLPLAYFLALSLIHFPGAVIHLDADEWDPTRLGFDQAVIGTVSFLIGAIAAKITMSFRRPPEDAEGGSRDIYPQNLLALDRLALVYCFLGAIAYFVLIPVAGIIPSVTAIISSFGSLIIVGVCLRLWVARVERNWLKFWWTMALLPMLPLSTLIQSGFLGFGIVWGLTIVAFLFAQSKRHLQYYLFSPVVLFVGTSLFVNYMASREDIRRLVWYDEASLGARVQRVVDMFQDFEWLDLSNSKHRFAIENRLNQNWLVGKAVRRFEAGQQEFASGITISNVIISLIPRAVWPEKPAVGGGGDIVSQFTGLRFAKGTSVGAGQVFEFYVNFGTWGVIGGFLLFGWLLGYFDLLIIEYLRRGDQRHFLLCFVVALCLVQPGGNLVEIVVGAAGAAVGIYGVNYSLNRRRPAINTPTLSQHMPM
jgi:hypothetical protein